MVTFLFCWSNLSFLEMSFFFVFYLLHLIGTAVLLSLLGCGWWFVFWQNILDHSLSLSSPFFLFISYFKTLSLAPTLFFDVFIFFISFGFESTKNTEWDNSSSLTKRLKMFLRFFVLFLISSFSLFFFWIFHIYICRHFLWFLFFSFLMFLNSDKVYFI